VNSSVIRSDSPSSIGSHWENPQAFMDFTWLLMSTNKQMVALFCQASKWPLDDKVFFWVNFVMYPNWLSCTHRKCKFGYKLNMKVSFEEHPSIFLVTYLIKPCIEMWWFFLSFWSNLLENLQKHLILAFFFYNIAIWLYGERSQKKGED